MPKALGLEQRHCGACLELRPEAGRLFGFAVYRGDVHAGTWEPLPALARFDAASADTKETTEQAPVQKYWWKDLGARRGGMFHYKIVPMGGSRARCGRWRGSIRC